MLGEQVATRSESIFIGLLKEGGCQEQASLHVCGLGNKSLWMPTAGCLRIPTVRVKQSHRSSIYSLWNFSFNMPPGMYVSHSGINTAIITPETMASFHLISFSSACPSPACLSFLSFSIYLCGEHVIRTLIFKDTLPLCYRSHDGLLSESLTLLRRLDTWTF